MVTRTRRPMASAPPKAARGAARVLIIESRYYDHIADELMAGAIAEIEARGAAWDRVTVPGALELPQALKQAVTQGLIPSGAPFAKWQGAVVLGCVVRGETGHYDIVCQNANHWLMETALRHDVPVGNGILTVDTEAQARARAGNGRDGTGGDAARACLALIELSCAFAGDGV